MDAQGEPLGTTPAARMHTMAILVDNQVASFYYLDKGLRSGSEGYRVMILLSDWWIDRWARSGVFVMRVGPISYNPQSRMLSWDVLAADTEDDQ